MSSVQHKGDVQLILPQDKMQRRQVSKKGKKEKGRIIT
jgi:hypothetical protein